MLRDSKNIILPRNSKYMNPIIEQHNFLMYIKNEFKLLVQKDTKLSLFVDEIHLKPSFVYTYLPNPSTQQDMTQGQFLSGV